MSQNTPKRVRVRVRELRPATLLIGERADAFETIRAAVEEEIQPRGIIELNYVDDMANLIWEKLRLRRNKANIVNSAFQPALSAFLRQYFKVERAEKLASSWFTDQEAKKEVAQLLAQDGLDESAIEAGAMKRSLPELEQLERMQTMLEARYNKALCMIEIYRAGMAQRLREAADKLMKSQNVPQLEDLSSKEPKAA
jgi:hypothetical protein